jgi:UDP-3-O-[3-hydroxymyristoyl] glucosamine N-acyltransferase
MDIGATILADELKHIIKEPIKIVGSSFNVFNGISPIDEADIDDLAFAAGKSGSDRIFRTASRVVITTEDIYSRYKLPDDKTYILVKNPRLAFIDCLNYFFPKTEPEGTKYPNGSVVMKNAKIGNNVKFGPGCVIGNNGFGFERREDGILVRFPSFGGVVIEDDVEIGSNVCIDRGTFGNTVIGKGTKIDNLVHVAHNTQIGKNCLIVAHAMIAGSVKIGDNCWISASYIRDGKTIGDNTTVGIGAVVVTDIPSNDVVVGVPAKSVLEGKS